MVFSNLVNFGHFGILWVRPFGLFVAYVFVTLFFVLVFCNKKNLSILYETCRRWKIFTVCLQKAYLSIAYIPTTQPTKHYKYFLSSISLKYTTSLRIKLQRTALQGANS
jgi:hypothetical protein